MERGGKIYGGFVFYFKAKLEMYLVIDALTSLAIRRFPVGKTTILLNSNDESGTSLRSEREMILRKRIAFMFLCLAFVFAFFTGCSQNTPSSAGDTEGSISSANISTQSEKTDFPEAYMVTTENYFDYQPGLECSAFASAYLLRHYGEEAEGLKLFENFPGKLPDGVGVYPSGVAQFWNDRGGYTAEFRASGTIDGLKQLVSTGAPVIVFVHVEEPYTSVHNTHFLPLVGYDADYFYFAESLEDLANCKDEPDLNYNRKTEISKFERLWKNIDGMWDNPYFVITKTE